VNPGALEGQVVPDSYKTPDVLLIVTNIYIQSSLVKVLAVIEERKKST